MVGLGSFPVYNIIDFRLRSDDMVVKFLGRLVVDSLKDDSGHSAWPSQISTTGVAADGCMSSATTLVCGVLRVCSFDGRRSSPPHNLPCGRRLLLPAALSATSQGTGFAA